MKTLLLTWIIVLGIVGLGLAQNQKEFVKTFAPEEDCQFAVFAINGQIDIETWDKPTIRIFTTVTTPNANVDQELLDNIAKTGRYQIEMTFHEEERAMIFEMPKQEKFIFVRGDNLEEHLQIKIYVPQHIDFKVENLYVEPIL